MAAETNFSAPPFAIPPQTPSDLRSQDVDATAPPFFQPGLANYGPFSYEPYNQFSDPFRAQLPEPNRASFPHLQPNRFHQHSFHGGSRVPGYYPPPTGLFQHGPSVATASGLNHSHYHGLPMSGHMQSDFPDPRNENGLLPMPPMSGGPRSYNLPPYSQPSPLPLPGYNPFLTQRPGSQVSNGPNPSSAHFGADEVQRTGQSRAAMRTLNSRNTDQPRHVTSPNRRTIHERQHQHHNHSPAEANRRSTGFLSPQSRRSDRSVSPRTSNRRSFDRYSTDLPRSHTSTNADESASRTAAARARRARAMAGLGYRSRIVIPDHPNTPTEGQMQALKDKLRHYLPHELPEDTSSCCDICQKDYATKHVLPSEEEEVAIKLPCPANHVFGEFCIHQWFETCKKHKNKITCPMCRSLLIEPSRPPSSLLGVPAVHEYQLLQDVIMARGLEDEFDHF